MRGKKICKSLEGDGVLSYSVKERFFSDLKEFVDISEDINKIKNLKEFTIVIKFRSNINSGDGKLNLYIRENHNLLCHIKSAKKYSDNSWHIVIMSLGDWGIKLYVDGNEVGYLKSPINLSMITELNSMNIGRALDNKGEGIRHFHGDIDYLDLYDRCLSREEVKELSKQEVKIGYDIPFIDLSKDKDRQVLVDKEEGVYLGHPSTVLMDDKKTMYVVYPKGHGVGAIVLKKSED